MIFLPYLCDLIDQDLKTQTRRMARAGDVVVCDAAGGIIQVYRNRRLLYEVGRTYAYQPGRGKPARGHFELLSIREQGIREISDADVRAEGFELRVDLGTDPQGHKIEMVGSHREALWMLWDDLHPKVGERWQDNPRVYALTFRRIETRDA